MKLKVTMANVASYRKPVSIEFDKKTNLIYGLNGTGKSTLASFFYSQADKRFEHCRLEGAPSRLLRIAVSGALSLIISIAAAPSRARNSANSRSPDAPFLRSALAPTSRRSRPSGSGCRLQTSKPPFP